MNAHSAAGCANTHPARRGGVWARCFDVGRLARTSERTFTCVLLLSTPHPSGFARHLPRFAEKGRATAYYCAWRLGCVKAVADPRECERPRRRLFPPGSAVTSGSRRRRTEKSSPASMAIRSA
jgi:hypothetical protein